MTPLLVTRGEIYTAHLDSTQGSEIRKTRPVLIVSNEVDNRYSPVVLVAPLSEQKTSKTYPTEVLVVPPEGGLTKPSRVSCMQVRALDKRRLCDAQGHPLHRWGSLSGDVMAQVDEALRLALGLA